MNNGPMKSPLEATQQIRQLLSNYIQQHQELNTSAWLVQAQAGLIAFNQAFPEGEAAKSYNLDLIKVHVLNNLAPQFVVMMKWIVGLHGASTLRSDLENAANSWPKHQDYLVYVAEQKAEQALKEKSEAESAKIKLAQEKAEAELAKMKLAEEKAAADANSEQVLRALQEQHDKLIQQLEALKLENQAKTQTVVNLRELNKELIVRAKVSYVDSAKVDSAKAESAKAVPIAANQAGQNSNKKRIAKK